MSDSPVAFKKRKTGASAARKRALDADDASTPSKADSSDVVRAAKRLGTGPLSATTGLSRRAAKQKAAEDAELEREDARDLGIGVTYSSSRNTNQRDRSVTPEWKRSGDPDDLSGSRLQERAAKMRPGDVVEGFVVPGDPESSLYKGAASYGSQLPAGSSRFGPIKAPSASIRTITLTDFQPDICKDYKETGFCGFGDSCKFLHDRSDYLHGWQLDNMFVSQQAAAQKQVAEIVDEEPLPFACLICREPFTEPVVTRCGHYFDQACALARYAKNSKCAACGAPTNGIFNRAEKLLEKRRKARELREGRDAEVDPYAEPDVGLDGIEGLDEIPEQ